MGDLMARKTRWELTPYLRMRAEATYLKYAEPEKWEKLRKRKIKPRKIGPKFATRQNPFFKPLAENIGKNPESFRQTVKSDMKHLLSNLPPDEIIAIFTEDKL